MGQELLEREMLSQPVRVLQFMLRRLAREYPGDRVRLWGPWDPVGLWVLDCSKPEGGSCGSSLWDSCRSFCRSRNRSLREGAGQGRKDLKKHQREMRSCHFRRKHQNS